MKKQLIDELSTLIAVFDAKLNDRQIDIYLEALADLDVQVLHSGCVELIKTARFFPRVAEIRQAANQAMERRISEQVEKHRRQRDAARGEWVAVERWDRHSPVHHVPAVVDWRRCAQCGQDYSAAWGECPVCSAVSHECEACGTRYSGSALSGCPVCQATREYPEAGDAAILKVTVDAAPF